MADNVHNPYRHGNTTGPGPKGHKTKKRGQWKCDCHVDKDGHTQVCECEGQRTRTGRKSKAHKTVRNDLRKKAKYRRASKRWNQRHGR